MRAVIDIGSNSIKCVVAQGVGTDFQVIRELSRTTRLGEELAVTGMIGPEAAERSLAYLRELSDICQDYGVKSVVCVGAETLRRASDAEQFARRLNCLTGWELRVLTPEGEARLSFEAASALAPANGDFVVIDSGGGSTEFSFGSKQGLKTCHSLPLGALTLTSSFIHGNPPGSEELSYLRNHIRGLLQSEFPRPGKLHAVACGGGVCALAAVAMELEDYEAEKVQGFWLSQTELERQIVLYGSVTEAERARIKGLPPGREAIILAGALVLEEILLHFELKGTSISSRGIRHALLAEIDPSWFMPAT